MVLHLVFQEAPVCLDVGCDGIKVSISLGLDDSRSPQTLLLATLLGDLSFPDFIDLPLHLLEGWLFLTLLSCNGFLRLFLLNFLFLGGSGLLFYLGRFLLWYGFLLLRFFLLRLNGWLLRFWLRLNDERHLVDRRIALLSQDDRKNRQGDDDGQVNQDGNPQCFIDDSHEACVSTPHPLLTESCLSSGESLSNRINVPAAMVSVNPERNSQYHAARDTDPHPQDCRICLFYYRLKKHAL